MDQVGVHTEAKPHRDLRHGRARAAVTSIAAASPVLTALPQNRSGQPAPPEDELSLILADGSPGLGCVRTPPHQPQQRGKQEQALLYQTPPLNLTCLSRTKPNKQVGGRGLELQAPETKILSSDSERTFLFFPAAI